MKREARNDRIAFAVAVAVAVAVAFAFAFAFVFLVVIPSEARNVLSARTSTMPAAAKPRYGHGFSRATKGRREAPSALPKAGVKREARND